MKKMKKTLALVLALVMALALAIPAMAVDPTYTITMSTTKDHAYTAYQVFKGDLVESTESGTTTKTLSNIDWGTGVNGSALLTALKDDDTYGDAFKGCSNAADVAKVLATYANKGSDIAAIAKIIGANKATGTASATADGATTISGLAAGYYLIEDTTAKNKMPEGDTYSEFMLEVVSNVSVTAKDDTVTNDKKIKTDTLGKDTGTNDINDDNDNVSIGDTVTFKIKATIPEAAAKYNYFYFIINDTLDAGLTLDASSIHVYQGDPDATPAGTALATDAYQVRTKTTSPTSGDYSFQVALNDAKAISATAKADVDIYVTYSATVNSSATIGDVPNKNTSTVTYSNNPNHDYNGNGNNPGFPSDTDKTVMGETPEKITKTFVTGIEIQKVDQDGKVLTGATFEISGTSTKKVLTVAETFEEGTGDDYVYYKLNNGTYTKTPPAAAYMNPLEAGATAGYVADPSATEEAEGYMVVDGVIYRAYVPTVDTNPDVVIYELVNSTASQYASTTTMYKKVLTKTESDATTTHKASMAVNANGLARFDGLGAGVYTITETETPPGYNTISPITVEIQYAEQADGSELSVWSVYNGTAVYDADEGIFKIVVKNEQGNVLPSTGGIGTKVFYALGAVLVIGAGVVLVSRKRVTE